MEDVAHGGVAPAAIVVVEDVKEEADDVKMTVEELADRMAPAGLIPDPVRIDTTRAEFAAPDPRPQLAKRDDIIHAIRNCFEHEHWLAHQPPEFWTHNNEGFKCHHDKHTFVGPKFSAPIALDSAREKWTVRKVFCSLSCVAGFMLQHQHMGYSMMLFSLMLRKVYNLAPSDVEPASDVELLEDPFHPMDIDTWRSLPRQRVVRQVVGARYVPFVFDASKVVSYITPHHPAYRTVINHNSVTKQGSEGVLAEAEGELLVESGLLAGGEEAAEAAAAQGVGAKRAKKK